MDKTLVLHRLQALATDDTNRSKTARLGDVIDQVELTLAAGVSRHLVWGELKGAGLDMSFSTFETTLKRLRQRRARDRTATAARPALASPAATTQPTPAGREIPAAHDPALLNSIIASKPNLAALAAHAKSKGKLK